jgi:hypothetical protein
MDEEKPVGILFLLHHAQTAVVAAPIGRLPVLDVVAMVKEWETAREAA